MENKHTIGDLYQMQSLPLHAKIRMTMARIEGWVNEFGEDGVYISFSGGKDSTVLMDIIRNRMNLDIPAVFVDVPTQFPELKQFATSWSNVEVLKPKVSFMEVCEKYGFPLISKEVSNTVYYAKQFYNNPLKFRNKKYRFEKPIRLLQLEGKVPHTEKGILTEEYSKRFDKKKYMFMVFAPFDVSDQCCRVMKKEPLKHYAKKTGRNPITAQMSDESILRRSQWIKYGCNGFEMKNPISNPMSFWTEQDILTYIHTYSIPICSVYGEVVEDYEKEGLLDGQVTFDDFKCDRIYKTTGCKRTGCMLCGFGCQNEKEEDSRFLLLRQTHPKMYNLLDVVKNNGVTFREAIEWINEHGNLNIKL